MECKSAIDRLCSKAARLAPTNFILIFVTALLILHGAWLCAQEALPGPNTIQIPDAGWKLWPDTAAAWKNDTLYLPSEVNLATLPVNAPTGGWQALDKQGVSVTLPSTVEQHFWGKLGLRPYTINEYTYAATDAEFKNGNYEGVSWWFRSIDIPASFAHKTVLLHLRGARQRAEIYVNHKLVGYDLIAETAFDSDISAAILPGQPNQIAIRITNPGGRLDWRDQNQAWGKYQIQKSPGFGGIDRGITLTAHDPVYLSDTWVLNKPEVRSIAANATLRNTTAQVQTGTLRFSVIDLATHSVRATTQMPATIGPFASADFAAPLTDPEARLWELDSPNLYGLRAEWSAGSISDTRTVRFGFRWFEPRGIGTDAGLYLNGKRIRIYTSISWGFWGLNGLWPTPELARKEVTTAKSLGLNTLNFHRNIGKEEVLAQQDELGLLRYMEPGGGRNLLGPYVSREEPATKGPFDTSGKGGDPADFLARYTAEKTLRMVKMFRSHPSLILYVVQNEVEPNVANPRVWNILRGMHSLDPSRVVAAKSGISFRHQAWLAPYNNQAFFDDGTSYSGWRDEHTVGGPGVWTDDLYQDPNHFTHKLDNPREINDWGEMLGAASADHHDLMVQQIKAAGGESYDLRDHQQMDAAYNAFLDQSGLRKSFSTTSRVYDQIGHKAFEFWGRVIETARLSDSNDILSISGWESTAMENHSGLVDNLRNLKGDPQLIAPHLAPLLPVVRPRGIVHRVGEDILLDLYLLNETGSAASGTLNLTLTSPVGQQTNLGAWPVPAYLSNHFVYPVKMAVNLPALKVEGIYKLTFSLQGAVSAQNSETLEILNPAPTPMPVTRMGVVGEIAPVLKQLALIPNIQAEAFNPSASYDVILAPQCANGTIVHINDGSRIANTDDEALYRTSIRGRSNAFTLHFVNLPAGPARVSLYFADSADATPGRRVFDIQLNHKTVATNFDIAAEAHGGATAVVRTFATETVDGAIDLGPGNVKAAEMAFADALFNAVKIEAGGKTFAYALGGETYTDKSGLVWDSYIPPSNLSTQILAKVRAGTPLIVTAPDVTSAISAATALADAGALQFKGGIPTARAPWMGNWILVRKHPIFDGLPQDEVMRGDYQFGVLQCYGLQVQGPGVQVLAGYGRDHSMTLGASIFTAPLGKGTVLFQGLTGGAAPLVETRLLANAVAYLSGPRP